MKNVQLDMNVDRQRRKLEHLRDNAPSEDARRYLAGLIEDFDAGVAAGQPQPASQFIPLYHEEFDIVSVREMEQR